MKCINYPHLFVYKKKPPVMLNQLPFPAALYILYPGTYVLGGVFYLLTMLVVRRDVRRVEENTGYIPINPEDEDSQDEEHYGATQ